MLLELADMSAGYGDVDIVEGIGLAVSRSEIVAVCGTNGAGKSTVTKAVMRLLPRTTGRVAFRGEDLLRRRTDELIGLGIGYVPQVANVFPSLTVLENLEVTPGIPDRKARVREIFDLIPGLADRRRQKAGHLSGGERQQLAFARAMITRPDLLILDEPTAALSPAAVSVIFGMIARLPETGVGILMVEQRARQALEISHRGYILDAGRVVMDGTGGGLLADSRMTDLYLGRADAAPGSAQAMDLVAGRPT